MPQTVLIVDDEKHTREGLAAALEGDYEVFLARDADEAFRLMEAEKFDVVLTDLRMAGKSGLSVIDKALALLKSGAPLMVRGWPEGGNVASQQADIVLRPYGEVQVERSTQGPFGFRRLTCAYVTAPAIAAGFAVIV